MDVMLGEGDSAELMTITPEGDLVRRECTWQTCHEPALANSPYCAKHADVVTPANLRAMLERKAAVIPPERRAVIERVRTAARALSDQRHKRRSLEKRARAAQRSTGHGKPHGRQKGSKKR